MGIEAIVKKHLNAWRVSTVVSPESCIRASLTELAAEYDRKQALLLDAHCERVSSLQERIRQLESERVPSGWDGWRDVAVHGYPEAAQEVLFVHKGKTVHGAFIGEIFWHSNEKCVAALWRPLPTPLNHDEWRSLLAAAPQQPKKEGE